MSIRLGLALAARQVSLRAVALPLHFRLLLVACETQGAGSATNVVKDQPNCTGAGSANGRARNAVVVAPSAGKNDSRASSASSGWRAALSRNFIDARPIPMHEPRAGTPIMNATANGRKLFVVMGAGSKSVFPYERCGRRRRRAGSKEPEGLRARKADDGARLEQKVADAECGQLVAQR